MEWRCAPSPMSRGTEGSRHTSSSLRHGHQNRSRADHRSGSSLLPSSSCSRDDEAGDEEPLPDDDGGVAPGLRSQSYGSGSRRGASRRRRYDCRWCSGGSNEPIWPYQFSRLLPKHSFKHFALGLITPQLVSPSVVRRSRNIVGLFSAACSAVLVRSELSLAWLVFSDAAFSLLTLPFNRLISQLSHVYVVDRGDLPWKKIKANNEIL